MSLKDYSLPELGEQLSFATAVEKLVKDKKADIRFEVETRLRDLSETTGADSMTLKVADEKVGKASLTQAKPAVNDPDAFGKWAYETGAGHRNLIINLDESPVTDAEIMGLMLKHLHDELGGTAIRVEYTADPVAKKDLEVRKGAVVSRTTGEVVPGTYAKPGYLYVSGCKPAEVGEAMQLAGYSTTVAGYLEGGQV